MINIIPPFRNIDSALTRRFLLENDFEISFSAKQKLYYSYLRPITPKKIRRLVQKLSGSSVRFKENFIYDELVSRVFEKGVDETELKKLYPDNSKFAVVLTHDVETAQGFKFIPKVIELEKKYNFRSSWNLVPYKYKSDNGILRFIRENNNELGIHGYNHDGKLYYSKKIFSERVKFINDALEKFEAVGFRSPVVHRNLEWLQELNIRYDCSCFDYDPFQPFPGGTGSIWPFLAGRFVELPYTLPQDHTLFYVLKEKTIDIWRKKTDWLVSHNGMILALTHPDYLCENNNLGKYEELLTYLSSLNNGCHMIPRELADWWFKKHAI